MISISFQVSQTFVVQMDAGRVRQKLSVGKLFQVKQVVLNMLIADEHQNVFK